MRRLRQAMCLMLAITAGGAPGCGGDKGGSTSQTSTSGTTSAAAAADISAELSAIDATVRSVLAEEARYAAKTKPGATEYQAFLQMCIDADNALQEDGIKLANKLRGRVPEATFGGLTAALAKLASTELGCNSTPPNPDALTKARDHLQTVIDQIPR